MRVELDVFSGRPNPRWELNEDSAVALRGLLSRLTVATTTPPEQPGLGYRGFVYASETDGGRAFRGYVVRSDVVLADPSSSVERFLRDHLPSELRGLRRRISLEGE